MAVSSQQSAISSAPAAQLTSPSLRDTSPDIGEEWSWGERHPCNPCDPCYPCNPCKKTRVSFLIPEFYVCLRSLDIRLTAKGCDLWRDFCAKQEGGSAVCLAQMRKPPIAVWCKKHPQGTAESPQGALGKDYSLRISIIFCAAVATGVPGPKIAAAPS